MTEAAQQWLRDNALKVLDSVVGSGGLGCRWRLAHPSCDPKMNIVGKRV
jgi:hypothetical protein